MAFGSVPRKNVLLLSCMDCRLLDDTVDFMNAFNLQNRYDQVVFAGTSLGVLQGKSPPALPKAKGNGKHKAKGAARWQDVFFQQLQVAINVLKRDIQDVFILEHRDCGAYKVFEGDHLPWYDDSDEQQAKEEADHLAYAQRLAKRIRKYSELQAQEHASDPVLSDKWTKLKVRGFLMDLCGAVKELPL
jgi:hypothetical protein